MTVSDLPLFLVSAGVYLERDGKILILERAAGALIGFWSLPGGLLDAGESPEDGARRELFEEAGLRPAGPLTLVAVTGFHVYGHDAIRLVYAGDAAHGEVRLSHEQSRARDPKEATIVEAVRTTFDEYLAWRSRR
jgi:ADP-ribose pyrophosphatase YjhB (NUDIX family)